MGRGKCWSSMLRWRPSITAACLIAVVPATAWAEEDEAPGPAMEEVEFGAAGLDVLQNRKYQLLHEISVLAGGLPVDPFYKGITGSLGYTLHFGESIAWEVLQFTYSFNIDTKLKKNLVNTGLALGKPPDPNEFPEIEWIAASHLVLKPLYGKQAFFNTNVVHLEVYLQAGPAFVRRGTTQDSLAFGFDGGFGVRLWLEEWLSLRIDIMELVYFLEAKPKQSLHMHIGLSFNLRGED